MNNKFPEFQGFVDLLKQRLKEKRFIHSLCVADEAARLAEKYGADVKTCYLAGLLHDITKNDTVQEHLNMFENFGIMLTDIEFRAEKLYHAISGAGYIKHILKIDNEEILDAVRYHTTAKANMPLITKILYLADFTSADRDYDDVDTMRELVDISLDEALAYALRYTVMDLAGRNMAIHPNTLEAYNEIMLKRSTI